MARTVLLISLALIAVLGSAYPAQAAVESPEELVGLEFEEIEAGEEEGLGEEEACEEVEEGIEECEEEEAEGRAANSRPSECLLRTARAHVVADAGKNQLKLTIGYTTYEPADATIAFRNGSLRLGSIQRHLGKSGVIRLAKNLSASQVAKLDAGDQISVQLHLAGAASSCKRVGQLSPQLVLR